MEKSLTKKFIIENYDTVLDFINLMKVGIFLSDGDGNVMMLNKESLRTGELPAEEVVGRNMVDLVNIGYVDESSILKAIETHDEYTMIQVCKGDTSLFLTATPFFDESGNIELVLCTERDITETIELGDILAKNKKLAEKQERELKYLRSKANFSSEIIAVSPQMKDILHTAERIAQVDTTVMLTGESGVGKEVIADFIFEQSKRNEKPFIKINCASIPDNLLESELFGYEKGAFTGADANGRTGLFEVAHEGTLLLDEVSEIPITLQAKLLRCLQEREIRRIGGKDSIKIDVRIIAATNIDLKKAVEDGTFREDLYYRLNVVPIEIPPLRERPDDIIALVEYFVSYFNKKYRTNKEIDVDALIEFKRAPWNGNIRELKNAVERLMVSYDGLRITPKQVRTLLYQNDRTVGFTSPREDMTLKEMMEQYEQEILLFYMNKGLIASELANKLGVDKSTISRKLKKYNL